MAPDLRGLEGRTVLEVSFSALLLVLAQPPFSVFPLAFLALTPLAVALGRLPRGPGGRWTSARAGFLFGVIYWGISLVWIPLVVGPEFSWAYGGYLLLLTLLGGLAALMGMLVHGIHGRGGIPLAVSLPFAWVAVEWIKGHVPFGLSFPWLGLGITLTEWPRLMGLAEWVGESGVAFWLAAVNGLVADALLARRTRSRRTLAGAALALLVLPGGLGIWRTGTLPLTQGPRVAAVATEVPVELRNRPLAAFQEGFGQVGKAIDTLPSEDLGFLVIPEGIVPGGVEDSLVLGERGIVTSLVRRLHAPLIFGGVGEGGGEGLQDSAEPSNSAFLVSGPSALPQRYDKSRLVPGMEAGRYEPGPGATVLRAGEWALGPLICYESLFGGMAGKTRREGARILVNLTSDVWFGRSGGLPGSLFLRQHPAHLVARAVEHRMPVARAANGGYAVLLDPLGRTVAGPAMGPGVAVEGRLPLAAGPTLFSRSGDWVGPASLLACLGLVLLGNPWKRRRWAVDPTPLVDDPPG